MSECVEFDHRISGIPCIIRGTEYRRYRPEIVAGTVENSHQADGGTAAWIVLDRKGRPAPWLERKLSDRGRYEIEEIIMDIFSPSN